MQNTPQSRETVMQELGLWPVWRLRDTPEPAPPGTQTDASAMQATPSVDDGLSDWNSLRAAVNACTRCKLHTTRTQGVLGSGDTNADWLFVGEAPGADEDARGEPFVGAAGKLLDAMLAAIDLQRGRNVYIANVLKSRPPGNRNPEADEVAACMPYLLAQIELLQPRIIVALGRFAAQNLLCSSETIARLRGRVHDYRGIPLIVSYHPAYLLRTLPDKAHAWEDLCLARRTYSSLQPASTNAP
jgi:DNA polymerase